VRGIPGVVADRGDGAARDERCPGVGGAGGIRGTRADRERERLTGVLKGVNELSGKSLKTRAI
jgi:hypothetical protein